MLNPQTATGKQYRPYLGKGMIDILSLELSFEGMYYWHLAPKKVIIKLYNPDLTFNLWWTDKKTLIHILLHEGQREMELQTKAERLLEERKCGHITNLYVIVCVIVELLNPISNQDFYEPAFPMCSEPFVHFLQGYWVQSS